MLIIKKILIYILCSLKNKKNFTPVSVVGRWHQKREETSLRWPQSTTAYRRASGRSSEARVNSSG